MSDHILPELMSGILSRLPVKSLLSSRCVSKAWRSLIDSQEFTKLHLRQSIKTTSNLSLIAGGRDNLFCSIDFDRLDKSYQIKHPLWICTVLASCNGVLLLHGLGWEGHTKFALFNPATRTHRILPDASRLDSGIPDGSYREAIGFGFDPVSHDFKVVHSKFGDGDVSKVVLTESETKIFSLKSNCWKMIKDPPYALPYRAVWGAYVNGALHIEVNQRSDLDLPKVIVALDLGAEDYRTMELPKFCADKVMGTFVTGTVLDKHGECLCFSVYSEIKTEIWVMKEYGVAQSWTKLLSVEPPVVNMCTVLSTLGFSKAGDKLLLHYNRGKFIWYDLQIKKFIDVSVSGLPSYFRAYVCVESLYRLDGGNKNQAGKEKMPETKNMERKRGDFLSLGSV